MIRQKAVRTIRPHIRLCFWWYTTWNFRLQYNWMLDERSRLCILRKTFVTENLPWRCTVFYPQFFIPFFPVQKYLWRHKKTISLKDARDVMKRICFQTKIADALTTLLSRYSNWTKPTTAATTHSNKMIVLSQLIVHGIQWAYDQAVRAVKIHSKDFNNFLSPKFEVCSSWIVWNWCNISVVFVCFAASNLSLDDRKRIMREGSSVDDITISSSTSVSRPRSVNLQPHSQR